MVSVCIPTYNGSRYIAAQLQSILAQLQDSDEVVVSDDGSTDGTLEIVSELAKGDGRIRLISHQKSYSKYAFDYTTLNAENAIRSSVGDYIFLADQDDVWMPGKVKLFLQALETSDLVLSDCAVVDAELNVLDDSYFKMNRSKMGVFNNLVKNSYLGCCMAFRRSVLQYALPFPKTLVPHDIWLGLLAEAKGKVSFLPTPTLYYRRHSANLSTSSESSSNTLAFKLYYRLMIVLNLIKRLYVG
ncbi:MAG: glycosyltransferase family 2 protein [Paludibacteraceae bacterium]|nr:glycosyltransferase family 2 protein [Paludibacteraceae bacterium]